MIRKATLAIFVSVFMFGALQSYAIPIKWELDINLSDGGTVSGSYVYDADSNIFSDISVSAVGGPFPAASSSLTSVLTAYSNSSTLDLVPAIADLTGVQDVYIGLASAMTNVGGVIDISFVETYTCDDSTCDTFTLLYSATSFSGTATATSVPEPATLGLLGLGLIGLGLTRRKRA